MLTDGRTDGRTDARTDDGRKVITIAHPEQSSGELKILILFSLNMCHLALSTLMFKNELFHMIVNKKGLDQLPADTA